MRRIFTAILVFSALLELSAQSTNGLDDWRQEDTIKISRDSLLNIIRSKDSIILQSTLDSLSLSNLLESVWWEKDSIQQELQNLKYALKLDTTYQRYQDSLLAEYNRISRWDIRDSLFMIPEDSVRSNLDQILDIAFHETSKTSNPVLFKAKWENLIRHLANDSTFFNIHYGLEESITVILKGDNEVQNAIFLTNEQADSAKVYVRGDGKHDIHMWIDDDVFLTHVLSRSGLPDSISVPYKDISGLKLPRKSLPKAPPKYWTTKGTILFQLNQWAFSNWLKGGDNRFTFLVDNKGSANYKKGKVAWNSNYWYRFGLIKSEGQKLFKNVDALRVTSNFSHVAYNNMSYSVTGQFDTQLFAGYKSPRDSVPVSDIMSPATLILGGGMVYKPSKALSVNLSPISGKFTFVLDTITVDQKRYGLKEGQRIKPEPGATLYVSFKKLLWKNINMNSSLRLFSNYVHNPQNIDVDWRNQFSLKVNKYVSTTLFLQLKYDDDIIIPFYEWIDGVRTKVGEGKRAQIQEQFGITFTYHL